MAEHKELLDYRTRLINRLESATLEFCAACRAAEDPFLQLKTGEWNVHQLAAHVWDVDQNAYGLRIRKVLEEQHPSFENYDADAWFLSHYDSSVPLEKMLTDLEQRAKEIVPVLRDLKPEDWNRLGHHQVQGDYTLQTWVERAVGHLEEHLEALKTI